MKKDYLFDLKDCVILDEPIYRDLILQNSKLSKQNMKFIKILQECINYVTDDERELSVDCYYKFKDIVEFSELYDILTKYLID